MAITNNLFESQFTVLPLLQWIQLVEPQLESRTGFVRARIQHINDRLKWACALDSINGVFC